MKTLADDSPHDLYDALVKSLPSDVNGTLRVILQSLGVHMVHSGVDESFLHWAKIWKHFIKPRDIVDGRDTITDYGHMNQLWEQAFSGKQKLLIGPVVLTRKKHRNTWHYRVSKHPELWRHYQDLTRLYYLAMQTRQAKVAA